MIIWNGKDIIGLIVLAAIIAICVIGLFVYLLHLYFEKRMNKHWDKENKNKK